MRRKRTVARNNARERDGALLCDPRAETSASDDESSTSAGGASVMGTSESQRKTTSVTRPSGECLPARGPDRVRAWRAKDSQSRAGVGAR